MAYEDKPWHHLTADEVAAALEVEPTRGLARDEARARLGRHDANRLAEKAPRALWLKFLDPLRSLLVIVLLLAAVLAWAIWRIGLLFSNRWVYIVMLGDPGATTGLRLPGVLSLHRRWMRPTGSCRGVALAGFLAISLEKWFWRRKAVSSEARERTR